MLFKALWLPDTAIIFTASREITSACVVAVLKCTISLLKLLE